MEPKRVGEIMVHLDQYPHVPYWFTLRQTMAIMEKAEIEHKGRRTLPRMALVFDQDYRLLGMAQRRDILRGFEPRFLAEGAPQEPKQFFSVRVDPNLSELSYEQFTRRMPSLAEQPVSRIMKPIRVTLDYDDHIVKCIYEMVEYDMAVIPVLKDQRVVGVVRSIEVFHEAARVVL